MADPTRTTAPLRRWQVEALAHYEAQSPADFLVTATPGAGKTALRPRRRRLAA